MTPGSRELLKDAEGVRARLGFVSAQAVYDVLHACARTGLLRRIEPAGHPARYGTRTGGNHHHLVCRSCGRTEDVDCVHGTAPCPEPSDTVGFAVDEAEVLFWGLCPDCSGTGCSGTDSSGTDCRTPQ